MTEFELGVTSDIGKYIDAIYIAKFIKMVLEVQQDGFGEISMKVTVNNGKIKVVSVNKNQVYSLAGLGKKE